MKLHVSSSSHTIKMATTGGMVTLPNLNMNMNFSSSAYCYRDPKLSSSSLPLIAVAKFVLSHRNMICCAESPSAAASTVAAEKREEKKGGPGAAAEKKEEKEGGPAAAAEKKEEKEGGPTAAAEKKEEKEGGPVAAAAKESTAPAKPKPPAKAPVKPLPEMMEEDVIPSLRSILEAQEDIKELNLFFEDNKLEGSFQKKSIPYTFWALFPNGLTGPKGFSLSSYGSTASNVEPFLVDEKKVTAKLLVFWVEKRLAAQGIIPVWKD